MSSNNIIGSHMDVVFFFYGLSFVAMGLAVALQPKDGSAFKWTKTLWLLAAFGVVHGINEWVDMWILIKGTNRTIVLMRWCCLTSSFVFLFEFGRRVIRVSIDESPACRILAAKYMGSWLTATATGTVIVISIASLKLGETAARYVLGFLGASMTSYGFYSYYKCEMKTLSGINIKHYFIVVSAGFFLYAVLGGLVVGKMDFFPADIINTQSFLQITGIPVQVFRALIATAVAFSMINILKMFNWEIARRQKEYLLRLQASEDRHKTLLETIPDVVYMIDKAGYFIYINNAVRALGYEPEELIGQHFSKILSPEDVQCVSRDHMLIPTQVDKASSPKLFDERRTGQRATFGLEVRIVKKKRQDDLVQTSGSDTIIGEVNSSGVYEINQSSLEKEYSGTLGLIKAKTGRSTGVIRDITARKREMDELRKSEQMMEEVAHNLQQMVNEEIKAKLKREQMLVQQSKMATMGEMIAIIAHQWKQPLNVIGLIVQDMEDAFAFEGIDGEYIQKAVKNVFEQINFMTRTVDEFRNFLRPSKEKTLFGITKAIDDVLFMNKELFKRNGIIVSFDKGNPSDDYQITGYSNEFKHVVLNLVNNAKDAILSKDGHKDGHKEGKIDIVLSKNDIGISIAVRDNGGGIADGVIERIFEPYFTTKPEQEGTGIGLYMSRTIIENRMGGRLTVQNVGDGAEFRIELQVR